MKNETDPNELKRLEDKLALHEDVQIKLQALRDAMDRTDEIKDKLRAEMHQASLKLFSIET